MVMRAADDDAGTVRVIWEDTDTELLRYVYAPGEEQVESPRPFFHPVRTLRGELASLYRPHDHVWHRSEYRHRTAALCLRAGGRAGRVAPALLPSRPDATR